jgi:hypothetical protein
MTPFSFLKSISALVKAFIARVTADGGIVEAARCIVKNTASLAMQPSGYKATKLYSQKPSSGVGDFTVDRNGTKTRVNSLGLIESVAANVPSLDYTDGNCPSLLLEPQGTNLVTYSQDFSDSSWIKTNTTINSNVVASPSGDIDASRINFNTASNSLLRFSSSSGNPNGKTYIHSIYLKADSSTSVVIGILGSGGGLGYILKTVNLTNDWQRFDVSSSFVGTGDNVRVRFLGTEIGSVFAWACQLEESSVATSYIPTSGSTVTRLADVVTLSTAGLGLTSITETIDGVDQAPITSIPATYTISQGNINKVTGV